MHAQLHDREQKLEVAIDVDSDSRPIATCASVQCRCLSRCAHARVRAIERAPAPDPAPDLHGGLYADRYSNSERSALVEGLGGALARGLMASGGPALT